MKSRTTPFTSKSSAKSFASKVGGKVTTQSVTATKSVHHVHYKSDGNYKGSNHSNSEPNLDSDSYTHSYDDV